MCVSNSSYIYIVIYNGVFLNNHDEISNNTHALVTISWVQVGQVNVLGLDARISFQILTEAYTSSTRTRRGGSCLRFDYKNFFIYRTCMRRAPARPVRVCIVRTCCAAVQEQDLRATTLPCKRQANDIFTLHTALFTARTPHSTLHLISSRIIWFLLTSCHLIPPLLISSHPFSHVI